MTTTTPDDAAVTEQPKLIPHISHTRLPEQVRACPAG